MYKYVWNIYSEDSLLQLKTSVNSNIRIIWSDHKLHSNCIIFPYKDGKSSTNLHNNPPVYCLCYCNRMRDARWILTGQFHRSLNTLNTDIAWLMQFTVLLPKCYTLNALESSCSPCGDPPWLIINTQWNYNYQSATRLLDSKNAPEQPKNEPQTAPMLLYRNLRVH